MKNKGIVAVVDDDRAVLQSLESLLESVGYIVRLFASAEALLASDSVSLTICVISDIGMPGMNGIALKALLLQRYPDLPVILITGNQELAQLRELKESRQALEVSLDRYASLYDFAPVGYITLNGATVITAPVAGAFSSDGTLFFVSTEGDNLIHYINTQTLTDTQQISPNLPACTPGSDPDCTLTTPQTSPVPATVIAVKPRSTT